MLKRFYKSSFGKLDDKTQGVIYILISCLSISIIIAIVRHLSKEMHIFQVVMLRNFFALLSLMPFITKNFSKIYPTQKIRLYLFRGLTGLSSMLAWFYVITVIPLPEAVSISFVVPIITTAAAILFLKEKNNKKIWISLIIGFIGILVILRPGFKDLNFFYVIALFSNCLWVISNILIKTISKTEKPESITFYITLVMFIFSIPFTIPYLSMINLSQLLWLIALGGLSNLSYVAISIAYRKTELSVLQPFDFSRLIFTSIIAYFSFGEIIDLWTIIGSLIILYSSLILVSKGSLKNKLVSLCSKNYMKN